MEIYRKQNFSGFSDYGGTDYSNLEFHQCIFSSSFISATFDIQKRTSVSDILFDSCEARSCTIYTAYLKNIVVNNLKTRSPLFFRGTLFNQVEIKGNIGRFVITPVEHNNIISVNEAQRINNNNSLLYRNINYSIDISQARFAECDIRGIPSRLVKRDINTQLVIKRSNVVQNKWLDSDLVHPLWRASLKLFLQREDEDVVLVAPKQNPNYLQLLGALRKLQDIGIAEPN